MKKFAFILAATAALAMSTSAFAGGTYRFTVSCSNGSGIAEWRTGDIDPGQEYLRTVTGTKNPGCGVGDYVDWRDYNLPVTIYEGPSGVVQGIPLLGSIVSSILGW